MDEESSDTNISKENTEMKRETSHNDTHENNNNNNNNTETTFRVCVNKCPFQIKSIINVDNENRTVETQEIATTTSVEDNSNETVEVAAGRSSLSTITTPNNNDNHLETKHKKKRRLLTNLAMLTDDSEDSSQSDSYDGDTAENDSKRVKSDINSKITIVEPTAAEAKSSSSSSSSPINETENLNLDEEIAEATAATTSETQTTNISQHHNISDHLKESVAGATAATTSSSSINNNSNLDSKFNTSDPNYWNRIYKTKKTSSFSFKDYLNRETGLLGPKKFQDKAINNLDYIRRMKLTKTLKFHDGCVNALNFNRIGTLLASGSDDYQVCIYDWARSRSILNFESGHKSNVFQCKFIPYVGDTQIATAARDGQVRLAAISPSGSFLGSKRLVKHTDSCHKLAIEYDSSNIFLSCGEDSAVYEIDLREETHPRILNVKDSRDYKLPLYSISSNPSDSNQFVVAGRDQYIRIYDKRMLVAEKAKVLKKFNAHKLEKPERATITSAVYNYNGTEVVASYSDDDICLFDVTKEDGTDAVHRYKGHRNSDTIKGVNFYGSDSSYIVSGSDCGRIFFWDKDTEQIIQALKGDENGVVNVLEPHPSFPVLATSGLDYDVKIWTPIAEEVNELKDLPNIIKENQRNRDSGRHFSLSTFEFELLLLLMHRPNNSSSFTARLRRLRRSNRNHDNENEDRENNESDEISTSSSSNTSDEDYENRMYFEHEFDENDYADDDVDEDDDDYDEDAANDYIDYEDNDYDDSEGNSLNQIRDDGHDNESSNNNNNNNNANTTNDNDSDRHLLTTYLDIIRDENSNENNNSAELEQEPEPEVESQHQNENNQSDNQENKNETTTENN